MELPYLNALLLLGVLLGIHWLCFRSTLTEDRPLRRGALQLALLLPVVCWLWQSSSAPSLLTACLALTAWLSCDLALEGCWCKFSFAPEWRRASRWLLLLAVMVAGTSLQPAGASLWLASAASLLGCGALVWMLGQLPLQRLPAGLGGRWKLCGLILIFLLGCDWSLRLGQSDGAPLPDFSAAARVVLTIMAAEGLAAWLESALRKQRRWAELAHLASDALRALIYSGLAWSILSDWNRGSKHPLNLSSAVFSLGLGFALKPTLGNLVSGLLMRLSHDFALGDHVQIGAVLGRVSRIDWRSITLTTEQHDELILPHAKIAAAVLLNLCRPTPQHANLLDLVLPRTLSPGAVRQQLLQLLQQIPQVSRQPAAEVYLLDLNGGGCLYRLRWWSDDVNDLPRSTSLMHSQLAYGLERSDLHPVQPTRSWREERPDLEG